MYFDRLSAGGRVRNLRRGAVALGIPFLLSLCLTACGGGDDDPASDESAPGDPTNTASALSLTAASPLTGEPIEGELPDHPVYAVKIDNTSGSAPQVGLGSADMIVEELVEGGLTRLAAFYYSDIPKEVGPVRSMRASDIDITKPVAANLVASGAARITIGRLASADVPTFVDGTAGFYRNDERPAPYNLFMDLSDLAGKPGSSWDAPKDPYLAFGPAADFDGTIKVKSIQASFSAAHTTDWAYSSKGWIRQDSYAQQGDDFLADNVLLLRVQTKDAGYHDVAGSPVPETILTGKGEGVLVHADEAARVTWSKQGETGTLQLTDKDGNAVKVPVGHTWIELVPTSLGSVTLGK
jgi:hypothetical protein